MPKKQLLLTTAYPSKDLAILLENGKAVEIFCENTQALSPSISFDAREEQALVGNIYLGIVVRVLVDNKMAFVDIGKARTALLHFNDCHKPPRQGEKCLVQVIKEPFGDKGARLTTKIRLLAHHFIYLPTQKNSVNISKKIKDLQVRERLVQQFFGKLQGGVVVRTSAELLDDDFGDLQTAITSVEVLWQKILQEKQRHYNSKSPKCLHQELPFFLRIIRDCADKDCQVIYDNASIIVPLERHHHSAGAFVYDVNLHQNFAIDVLIKNALACRVNLPSGGFIVIDEVEAMTVIDVNAGASNNPFASNLEATAAIANAVRLKNLSGIIVIDFIDMPKSAHAQVINHLKSATKNDSMSVKIYEFSRLGLLEMTRERKYLPLSKVLLTK